MQTVLVAVRNYLDDENIGHQQSLCSKKENEAKGIRIKQWYFILIRRRLFNRSKAERELNALNRKCNRLIKNANNKNKKIKSTKN